MTYQARVSSDGEMIVPAALAEALGLLPGDKVEVELDARAIKVASLDPLLEYMRECMRRPEIAAEVDAFIESRREEARLEDEKWRRLGY